LMSYGESFRGFFRRSATFVDKLIKGAKAADLPIEQPSRFYLTGQSQNRQSDRRRSANQPVAARRRDHRMSFLLSQKAEGGDKDEKEGSMPTYVIFDVEIRDASSARLIGVEGLG